MSSETTHPSLLSRVRDLSDHAAWREFDARYRDLILRYARRRGLQPTDAEDVRQMVMLNLARQLRTFEYRREKGRFRDYLGRSACNAIHRLFRSPRPESRGLDTSVAAAVPAEEEGELDRVWEHEWMLHHHRRAMARVRAAVDPKSVDVFEHLLAGEELDDVARAFGMTRDAVRKVKSRIKARLRELVAQQVYEEEDEGARAAP